MNLALGILSCATFIMLSILAGVYIFNSHTYEESSWSYNKELFSHITNINSTSTSTDGNSWLYKLSSNDVENFAYPTPELSLSFALDGKQSINVIRMKDIDQYSFFCISEVLKNNKIDFAYKKDSKDITLEVVLDNKNKKKQLMNELDKYNISYTIQ